MSKEEIYLEKREMIYSLSEQCIFYRNNGEYEKAESSIMELCSIYHEVEYYDLEAKTLHWLASFCKQNSKLVELEKILDDAMILYKKAIEISEENKLYSDNNTFFLDLAEDYIYINAFNKALDAALSSIKYYSVGIDVNRTVKVINLINTKTMININHYLYSLFGKENVKKIINDNPIEKAKTFNDPIEDTLSYRKTSMEIEDDVRKKLKEMNEENNQEKYYEIKKEMLLRKYSIIWDPPSSLKYDE